MFSEVAQWQVFFVMLSALMIKANIDAGEMSEDQGVYDVVLIVIQFMAPLLTVLTLLKKGETAARGYARSRSGRSERRGRGGGRGGEGNGGEVGGVGLELAVLEGGRGGVGVTLGGGRAPPRPTTKFECAANPLQADSTTTTTTAATVTATTTTVKNKADAGRRPNSSFDAYKNPGLATGGGGKGKKSDGLLKVNSKGLLAKKGGGGEGVGGAKVENKPTK